jgi:hypothetical protein
MEMANSQDPAVPDVPVEKEDLLGVLHDDFKRLQKQKARMSAGVEGTVLTNLCFINDEQYAAYQGKQLSLEPQDANKLYLTFNLIAPRTNKLIGRLSAFNAPFKARPNKKDPQAIEEAEIVDRMIMALDEKVDQPSRIREVLYWLVVAGTAFEYVPWIPNSSIEPMPQFDGGELLFKDLQNPDPQALPIPESAVQQMVAGGERAPEEFEIYEEIEQVGEVGSEILGPLNVFVDSSVRSVKDLSPDQWVHIARPKTVGWIQENFNVEVTLKKTSRSS